jgi:hypothetical protein
VTYPLTLVAALAALFVLQALALRASGGRTAKGESNYFSSLARIQTGIAAPRARIYLLGSSLTGRLPDRSRGFWGVANLGCDGGGAVDTLRALHDGRLPVAPVLVVEANTLHRAAEGRGSEVGRAIGAPWFRVGCRVPWLGATARPSALLYNALMVRKFGAGGSEAAALWRGVGRPEPLGTAGTGAALGGPEQALLEELASVVGGLKARGCRLVVVVMPPGGGPGSPQVRLPRELAARCGLEWWDLAGGVAAGEAGYTDGVHLDPASAAAAVRTLLDGLGELRERGEGVGR